MLSDTQALSVTVSNVNEAPVISGDDTASVGVNENSTVVTTVASGDPEGSALTYSIAGGADATRFTIDAATGVLAFVTAPTMRRPQTLALTTCTMWLSP